MNSSQIHLAFTHVPVILSITGSLMLIVSLIIKNEVVTKTSYWLCLLAGIFSIPVFLTGEGAEALVEKLPGVSENVIGRHEDAANFAFGTSLVTACLALLALLFFNRTFSRLLRLLVLVITCVTAAAMFQTAQLGGQVRHTEIRNSVSSQGGNGTTNGTGEKHEVNNEK